MGSNVVNIDVKNLKMLDKWIRLFFMVIFAIINYFVRLVILAVAIFQFLTVLFVNRVNDHLIKFGNNLSTYSYQIMMFLTYNSDEKPFPFLAWPSKEKSEK